VDKKVASKDAGRLKVMLVEKKIYEKPRLQQLGTLQELTRQYTGSTPEEF